MDSVEIFHKQLSTLSQYLDDEYIYEVLGFTFSQEKPTEIIIRENPSSIFKLYIDRDMVISNENGDIVFKDGKVALH